MKYLVDMPYLIGSGTCDVHTVLVFSCQFFRELNFATKFASLALFLIGSMLSLLMWKNEQFGLSLLSYINPGGKAYFAGFVHFVFAGACNTMSSHELCLTVVACVLTQILS